MSCLGKIDCFAPKPSASAMDDVDLDEDHRVDLDDVGHVVNLDDHLARATATVVI